MHACATPAALAPSARLRYGAWAVPLAFAALPLYVHWPAHMAAQPGWNLAALGGLLLAVRVIDAALDPWIGQRLDRLGERGHDWLPRLGLGGAALMGAGWSALFLLDWPPGAAGWSLAALALLLTSLGYSVAQLALQAWGVQLAQAESQAGPDHAAEAAQVRWVSARELGALAGVLVASLLPALAGWPATVALWWLLAGLAAWALLPLRSVASAPWSAPVRAAALVEARVPPHTLPRAWVGPLLVQLVSGIASAVPSALVLLVVGDVLGGGPSLQALALLLYFGSAAAALPLASRAVQRWGVARAWSLGMGAAALAFLPFEVMTVPNWTLLFTLLRARKSLRHRVEHAAVGGERREVERIAGHRRARLAPEAPLHRDGIFGVEVVGHLHDAGAVDRHPRAEPRAVGRVEHRSVPRAPHPIGRAEVGRLERRPRLDADPDRPGVEHAPLLRQGARVDVQRVARLACDAGPPGDEERVRGVLHARGEGFARIGRDAREHEAHRERRGGARGVVPCRELEVDQLPLPADDRHGKIHRVRREVRSAHAPGEGVDRSVLALSRWTPGAKAVESQAGLHRTVSSDRVEARQSHHAAKVCGLLGKSARGR